MRRISEVQAKKSLKKANEDRQYGHGSVELFINCSADLMDLFAQYLESQMTVPPRKGAGSRWFTAIGNKRRFSKIWSRFRRCKIYDRITRRSTAL